MREGEIGPVGKADLSRTLGALREGITQAEGNEGERGPGNRHSK